MTTNAIRRIGHRPRLPAMPGGTERYAGFPPDRPLTLVQYAKQTDLRWFHWTSPVAKYRNNVALYRNNVALLKMAFSGRVYTLSTARDSDLRAQV